MKKRLIMINELLIVATAGLMLTFCSGGRVAVACQSEEKTVSSETCSVECIDECSGEELWEEPVFSEEPCEEVCAEDNGVCEEDIAGEGVDVGISFDREGPDDREEDLYIDVLEAEADEMVNDHVLSLYISVSACSARGDIAGYAMKGPFEKWEEAPEFETGDFGEENSFEVTGNGEYYFSVRDSSDRRAFAKTRVDIIDRSAPVIASVRSEALEDKNGYGYRSVITVYAYDMGSGLHREAFSYDDGESYTDAYSAVTDRNGVYNIRVRDGLGNVSRQSFEVRDIDDEAPLMTITGNRETKSAKEVILRIECTDEKSGIASIWYGDRDDEQKKKYLGRYEGDKSALALLRVDKNDSYTVYAADLLGNMVCQTVNVDAIDKSIADDTDKKTSSSSVKTGSSSSSVRKPVSSSMSTLMIGMESGKSDSEEVTRKELVLKKTASSSFFTGGGEKDPVEKTVMIRSEYEEDVDDVPEQDLKLHPYTVSLNTTSADLTLPQVERIEGEYPVNLAVNETVSSQDIMPEKEEKGVASQKVIAVGIVIVLILAALLIRILIRLGVIDPDRLAKAVKEAKKDYEDDE